MRLILEVLRYIHIYTIVYTHSYILINSLLNIAQVMACYLVAPKQNLTQYWLGKMILGVGSTNERIQNIAILSLNGWAHIPNKPCKNRNMDFAQNWPNLWLVAWRHQTMTWPTTLAISCFRIFFLRFWTFWVNQFTLWTACADLVTRVKPSSGLGHGYVIMCDLRGIKVWF